MFQTSRKSQNRKYIFLILLALVSAQLLFITNNYAAVPLSNTEQTIELSNNNEFSYQQFKITKPETDTNTVALWILAGYPHQQRFYQFAQQLSNNGIEVWLVNILDNLFMPKGVNSTRKLTGKYVAELIQGINKKTNKKVILMAESYSAIPVLRGAQQWQLSRPKTRYLTGAVLFSPNLFKSIPTLGTKPEFVDVATSTTIPIMLYQSQKSNTRGQFLDLLAAFRKTNTPVFTTMLKNASAIFYTEDKAPETDQYLNSLPQKIAWSLKLLESSPLPLYSKAKVSNVAFKSTSLDSALRQYQAKNSPLNINLKDINGKNVVKTDYKNKVTIINFWATWCKPCLEEIPSLNRLKATMKDKAFEIISINYAEKPETIRKFMEKVKIDFPVLIDESGEQAVNWNVFAFPSTFVIGPDGEFKYGVNAGILWDTPEVISALNDLYKTN